MLDGSQARVTVAGYSFGGTTAVNLCRELYEQGSHTVDALCLCDAVKRRSRYPWGWLSALNRAASLRLPPNVLLCDAFYQTQNWPRGHKVLPAKGLEQEQHVKSVRLQDPHAVMDNHTLVRAKVVEHAQRIH